MTSVEYGLMGLRDGIKMNSELRKKMPKPPMMNEPIVMYHMGRTQIFPPYKYPLFLNPEHWITRYLLTEVQYKEMIEFEQKMRPHIPHNEKGTIAKWKIYLK